MTSKNPMNGLLTWKCIDNCGACCRLAPLERVEAIESLNESQLDTYRDMVGEDGWCRHYDTALRKCLIYNDRPDFCRVELIAQIFKIQPTEANNYSIKCCRQQIRSVYGGKSQVLRKFERSLRA